jgi:DnaJ-class molecular chaperone
VGEDGGGPGPVPLDACLTVVAAGGVARGLDQVLEGGSHEGVGGARKEDFSELGVVVEHVSIDTCDGRGNIDGLKFVAVSERAASDTCDGRGNIDGLKFVAGTERGRSDTCDGRGNIDGLKFDAVSERFKAQDF